MILVQEKGRKGMRNVPEAFYWYVRKGDYRAKVVLVEVGLKVKKVQYYLMKALLTLSMVTH